MAVVLADVKIVRHDPLNKGLAIGGKMSVEVYLLEVHKGYFSQFTWRCKDVLQCCCLHKA